MNVVQGLLSAVSPLSDGDFADRLNYCVTTVGLVLTSAFISGWSFVGSPIQCWFPAYYKGWWMEYALDYCYVQNTYFIPMTDVKVHNAFDFGSHIVEIPSNYTDRETKQIGYYQWVPFILAAQAILFYLPVVLWRALYESSGFKVRAICDTCSMHANMDEISRNKNMRTIAAFLVEEQSLATVKAGKVRRITSGSYITMVYLAVKFLYALNTIVQFIFLKNILGVKSYMWGLDVTIDLWQGREWPETGNFPRVTMCDYDVRVLGNLHRHTVQCVLMINMFNEKIFVVLWYWLCVMLIVSVYSFAKWTIATATTSFSGRVLVNNFIQQIDPTVARSEQKRSLLQEFVIEKLRTDGVFLLRLVAENSGDMVTLALLKTLWKDFMASKSKNPPLYAEPLLLMFFLDAFLKGLKPQYDDDSCDRLNYYYTPMLFVLFSLTLSAKQYVGQPIQCWIPAQFTGNFHLIFHRAWEQYSENYCFVQNTYFVRPDHYIPDSIVDRENNEIGYYQWVPFILGLQAILFYLPALFWRLFNWQSGIAVKSLVRMARDTTNMQLDRKREAVAVVGAHIHDSLRVQRRISQFNGLTQCVHRGMYLNTLYLFVKVLYLVQVLCQFLILNSFLSTNYTMWGFGILNDLLHGREWEESGHFPRVTMCDFEVRVLGNKHRHSVQCVLMINMFNEKVYLFIWFWLLGIGIYTAGNFIYWCLQLLSDEKRISFVGCYLKVLKLVNEEDLSHQRLLNKFVQRSLRADGVFILHLISKNAGDIITSDIIATLWKNFLEDEAEKGREGPQAPTLDDVDGFKEQLDKRPLN
ncbi:hypothetical protein Angca_006650 [Angiostrongylus cantonensis]|nr:hypothetical protein Angca_006650 [Angiostrongylus cantonensis]